MGWIGTFLIVLAYGLLATKKIYESFGYHAINLIGALFLFCDLFVHQVYSAATLQIIWIAIAAYGMWTWRDCFFQIINLLIRKIKK